MLGFFFFCILVFTNSPVGPNTNLLVHVCHNAGFIVGRSLIKTQKRFIRPVGRRQVTGCGGSGFGLVHWLIGLNTEGVMRGPESCDFITL